jgi:Family of unknown function (DUF5677)
MIPHHDHEDADGMTGGATISIVDGFNRAHVIGQDIPKAWRLACQLVIDHGSYVLQNRSTFRPNSTMRDLLLSTLVRRALVTAEGIRLMALYGLYEPAYANVRTLVEIQLRVNHLIHNPSEQEALTIVGFQYKMNHRTGTAILTDRATRASLEEVVDGKEYVLNTARTFKEALGATTFAAVADEIARRGHWHGLESIEEAFRAVGDSPAYNQLYCVASELVHGDSPDRDLVDVVDKQAILRPLSMSDTDVIGRLLGETSTRLWNILYVFVTDRRPGPPTGAELVDVSHDRPAEFQLWVLIHHVLDTFAGLASTVKNPDDRYRSSTSTEL